MAERPEEDRTNRPYMLMRVSLNTEQREVTFRAANLSDSSAAEIMAAGADAIINILNSGALGNRPPEVSARLPAVSPPQPAVEDGASEASEGPRTDSEEEDEEEETPDASPSETPPSSPEYFQNPPASPNNASATPRYIISDNEGGQDR